MDRSELATILVGREPEAILRTLAMMAYNPAIGRVLQEGGVGQFADLMSEVIPQLYMAQGNKAEFDFWHASTCDRILKSFKTARDQTLSYGVAQKPVNVFLKIFVDWAKQTTRDLAEKLTPWLHVPLDSLVMKFIKREFHADYEQSVGAIRRLRIERAGERLSQLKSGSSKSVARMLVGAECSLVGMDKEMYLAWQHLLRDLWPGKPVQLDIIWVLERRSIPLAENDEPESK